MHARTRATAFMLASDRVTPHVVARDEQRATVLFTQLGEPRAHPSRDVGVERGGRFVEHEQARAVQGRAHDPDQRPLARRELGAHRSREMRDAEPLEPGIDLRVGVGDPVEASVEPEVLTHAQALGQRQVARRETDLGRGAAAIAVHAKTADLDRAGVGRDHTEDHQERRRLAGAVGTEQPNPLARVHQQVDAIDGAGALVVLHEAACIQDHVTHADDPRRPEPRTPVSFTGWRWLRRASRSTGQATRLRPVSAARS
jgi:hypothetical protein